MQFGSAVAESYERYMVPLFFAPYAGPLAARVAAHAPARVLELAAGTGVATRALAAALPDADIVATDLHEAMLDRARAIGAAGSVAWRAADAHSLPFDAAAFDAVACTFGVMFFGDRVAAYREVHRVLRPGGRFVFATWDALAANRVAALVDEAVGGGTFFARIPHGYFDPDAIRADLAAAGFGAPSVTVVPGRSRAASAEDAARALCAGSPLRDQLSSRGLTLDDAIAAATAHIARELGTGPIDAAMQALFVEATR